MSYSNGTFNLTYTKLQKWHLSAQHNNKVGCIYCEGDMEKIAEEFKKIDIEILSVGHAWVKIKAVKNYSSYGGGRTDEIKQIYNLIVDNNSDHYVHQYNELYELTPKTKLSTSKQRYAVTMQFKELFGKELNLTVNTTHDEISEYFKIISEEKERRGTK